MKHAIAIDGPAGAGKTTLARMIAEELSYVYVDTGALYRAFAVHKLWLIEELSKKDASQLPITNEKALAIFDLEFQRDEHGEQQMILYGKNINPYLRTEEVSMEASTSSADPAVRVALLEFQRKQAMAYDVVMEGRDIGTVVLPNADVKIFLTASAEMRAKRRYFDLLHRGEYEEYESVLKKVLLRDHQDSTREACPLKQAEDAILVDSSGMDIIQTRDVILKIIREKIG